MTEPIFPANRRMGRAKRYGRPRSAWSGRAALALVLVLLAAPARAEDEERSYAAGAPVPLCVLGMDVGIGGSCFPVGSPNEPLVSPGTPDGRVHRYRFTDDLLRRAFAEGTFCDSSEPLWVPVGATTLAVFGEPAQEGCAGSSSIGASGTITLTRATLPGELALTSSGFAHGERMPDKYTQYGENVSPPLSWSGLPENTVELALVVEDPDAPSPYASARTILHWLVYGIDPASSFGEGSLPAGAIESGAYRGPRPPDGSGPHRYFFTLYALSAPVTPSGDTPEPLLASLREEMRDKLLDVAQLIGTYSRP